MTQTIGIAGTGRMGTAFARRLIETGHSVHVWNRSPARLAAAVGAGATATDLAGLAACDTILLSLTDAAASEAVLERLINAGLTGRLVIELSTLLPADADALAARATASGADFLHCPVGGTVAPALKGQLLGLAGGTRAAFDRAMPVLGSLCRRFEHLGTPGAAARMKLAINLPLAIYWETLGESLALLRGAGVPNDLAISLIADSSAGPTVLKNRAQVVVDTLNGTDQPGTFDIAGLTKDLMLALTLAETEGAFLPLAQSAVPRMRAALDAGLGHCDGATLTRLTASGS
ncbi:NAD(P)-dependent oxidoreductase [Tabrizicola sp.]|uniref:NAD(P)-dependent oxidoreductase n=1 Tax=Tabrizicola sp. TaxID=2005166 RepID=UPI00261F1606|nr:NAD(P)-dependent oxidoreductase [Tabrizicola sp.]MDM7932271.1 NAD(P)-dependent oxidoreductase [Tabrizicola sp.]